MSSGAGESDASQFYARFFVEQRGWSNPFPNYDEAIRAGAILPLLARVAESHYLTQHRPLEILDVGSGRGWLTSLASVYGTAVGIEPVNAVVEHARRLFPHLTFHCSDPVQLRAAEPDLGFDVILCSEVIEHVTSEEKPRFLASVRALTRPSGAIILTTPRGELFDAWRVGRTEMQPIEEWITEPDLDALAEECGCRVVSRDRCRLREFRAPLPRATAARLFSRFLRSLGIPGFRPWREMIYQVLLLAPK